MDDVQKIKDKIDIVDFIGEYIPLKKAGRNFKALCPFHSEKTPSFVVSAERQIWHCFGGCSKGGDIFTFLMEYEKIEFSEALRYLAQKAGVHLTKTVFATEQEKKKDLIYALNHLTTQFYHYLLTHHPAGKNALSYLTQTRRIPLPLIQTFSLGYAPAGGDALTKYLVEKKQYHIHDLIHAGLATQRGARTVDFFIHRIMFPIYDVRGNIMAFSGRALEGATLPKYINTKETLVYRKSESLFGLYFAKEGIKKEKRVIVVEGEFDVISAFKEGITSIVAVKGTALTEQHIKLLKRYAEKVSFCFDTDAAGVEAQRRSITLIEKEGITTSVITLPQGKDPDELIRETPHLFKQAVKQDTNIYDFIIDSSLATIDAHTTEGKKKVLETTLPFLTVIDNEVIKEHYFKKLALHLDTSVESLVRQAEKMRTGRLPEPSPPLKKKSSREELLESYLLTLILQAESPPYYLHISTQVLANTPLSTPSYDKLYKNLNGYAKNTNTFAIREFSLQLPSELTETFDICYLTPLPPLTESKYKEEVEKISRQVKELSIKHMLKGISQKIREEETKGNEDVMQSLWKEFNRLTSLLKGIPSPPVA